MAHVPPPPLAKDAQPFINRERAKRMADKQLAKDDDDADMDDDKLRAPQEKASSDALQQRRIVRVVRPERPVEAAAPSGIFSGLASAAAPAAAGFKPSAGPGSVLPTTGFAGITNATLQTKVDAKAFGFGQKPSPTAGPAVAGTAAAASSPAAAQAASPSSPAAAATEKKPAADQGEAPVSATAAPAAPAASLNAPQTTGGIPSVFGSGSAKAQFSFKAPPKPESPPPGDAPAAPPAAPERCYVPLAHVEAPVDPNENVHFSGVFKLFKKSESGWTDVGQGTVKVVETKQDGKPVAMLGVWAQKTLKLAVHTSLGTGAFKTAQVTEKHLVFGCVASSGALELNMLRTVKESGETAVKDLTDAIAKAEEAVKAA